MQAILLQGCSMRLLGLAVRTNVAERQVDGRRRSVRGGLVPVLEQEFADAHDLFPELREEVVRIRKLLLKYGDEAPTDAATASVDLTLSDICSDGESEEAHAAALKQYGLHASEEGLLGL